MKYIPEFLIYTIGYIGLILFTGPVVKYLRLGVNDSELVGALSVVIMFIAYLILRKICKWILYSWASNERISQKYNNYDEYKFRDED